MAKNMSLEARWGSPFGRVFDADTFLSEHPQYGYLKGYLKSFPTHSWNVFLAGDKEYPFFRHIVASRKLYASSFFTCIQRKVPKNEYINKLYEICSGIDTRTNQPVISGWKNITEF